MADDDDDEVGLDGDQEPATTGTESVAAAGSAASPTVIPVKKGTRPISDNVRRVFQESMAKAKAAGKLNIGDDDLEPLEHDDAPQEPAAAAPHAETPPAASAPANTPAPIEAAPAATTPPAPVTPPPAAPPPAPSLDPEVMRMRAELDQQRKDFESEKSKWFEQSRTSDLAKLRDTYFDKGAPAIGEVIKQWMPGLSDEEMKREVADLIQDLAHQYLDAPLDEPVKDRITNKRTRAGLKLWREEQDRLAQEQAKKQDALLEEQNRVRVKGILHQEVNKPEHAATYPFLAAEPNAGELVFEVIDTQFKKDGTQITWMDAAKRANDWLQSQALAYFDKRKHLLSPQPPPQQPPAPSDTQRAQGDSQVRRSHAPPTPPAKPTQPQERPSSNQKWTPEQHRRNTMNKFRTQVRNQFADDE